MHEQQTTENTIPEIEGVIEFSPEERQEIERLKGLYPSSKSAIMPVLWMAQKKWGWLSLNVMRCVAECMDLPYSHVYGVASFYTMYFKKPMGRFHVQVCTNVSCMLRGGEQLFEQARTRYGIGHNQRTPDGTVSIEMVECMGACGGAPMIAINEDYYENVTPQLFDKMLNGLPDSEKSN